jgi:hypothetical protein
MTASSRGIEGKTYPFDYILYKYRERFHLKPSDLALIDARDMFMDIEWYALETTMKNELEKFNETPEK